MRVSALRVEKLYFALRFFVCEKPINLSKIRSLEFYEATRRIRLLGTATAKKTPIIATTANVFRENIEKCFESGMTGHLGKPLDMTEVFKFLQKHLKHLR